MSELEDAAREKLNEGATAEAPYGYKADGTPAKKRGRKPGQSNRPSNPTPPDAGSDAGQPFIYVADENSIKASKAMGMTVWALLSLMLPIRPLTDEEGTQLGTSLDPVLCKWIPIIGEWKYEAALLMTVFTLWQATKIENTSTPTGSEATVIDESTS